MTLIRSKDSVTAMVDVNAVFILGKEENHKHGDVYIKIADKDPYDYPGNIPTT